MTVSNPKIDEIRARFLKQKFFDLGDLPGARARNLKQYSPHFDVQDILKRYMACSAELVNDRLTVHVCNPDGGLGQQLRVPSERVAR